MPIRKDNSYVIEKIDNSANARETKVLKRVNLVDDKGEPKRIKWDDIQMAQTASSVRFVSKSTSSSTLDTPVSSQADDKGSKNGEKNSTQKPPESVLKTNQEDSKNEKITLNTNCPRSDLKDQDPVPATSKTEGKGVAEQKEEPTSIVVNRILQLQRSAAPSLERSSSLLFSGMGAAGLSKQKSGLSPAEIQQKLLKIFNEGNMQKNDYRNRTLDRIKNSPRRSVSISNAHKIMHRKKLREKLESLTQKNPAQKNLSMEQLNDDWDSLTEVLSTTKPASSNLSLNSSGGDRDEPAKDPALKTKSDSKSSNATNTNPTEADAPDSQNPTGLSLPFLSDLNGVITWNRQNRTGVLPMAILTFERNEFGMLELNFDDSNRRGLKRSESPKIRGRGRKRVDAPKLLCNHSGFEECFNTIIRNLRSEFWINQTTPAEHYSKEFKDIVKLCIQKHEQKCFRVSRSDIRSAMAVAGLQKKTLPMQTVKFDWESYLANCKATKMPLYPAPLKFFFNPIPKYTNPFEIGHKLEAIDPLNCSKFCVCSVVEVSGFRIKLHMDGYHQIYDFWVNANSTEIFSVGWCDRSARTLHLPFGSVATSKFSWVEYLRTTKSAAAPRICFPHMQTLVSFIFDNELQNIFGR